MRPAVLPSPSSLAPTVQSPPKIPISKQLFPKLQRNQHQPQPSPFRIKISRRDAALLSFFALVPPPPATAFTIGISGPKDWLREQKKKASKFLFAPIDASRESLRTAYRLLTPSGSDDSNRDMGEVLRLLRSAARDCVMQERNLFVAFQASTGVEVCTFRLIVKNASSLLANNDPAKLEAEAMLDDLVRSLTTLNNVANEADVQLVSSREKVVDALVSAISSFDKFEQGVQGCLEA